MKDYGQLLIDLDRVCKARQAYISSLEAETACAPAAEEFHISRLLLTDTIPRFRPLDTVEPIWSITALSPTDTLERLRSLDTVVPGWTTEALNCVCFPGSGFGQPSHTDPFEKIVIAKDVPYPHVEPSILLSAPSNSRLPLAEALLSPSRLGQPLARMNPEMVKLGAKKEEYECFGDQVNEAVKEEPSPDWSDLRQSSPERDAARVIPDMSGAVLTSLTDDQTSAAPLPAKAKFEATLKRTRIFYPEFRSDSVSIGASADRTLQGAAFKGSKHSEAYRKSYSSPSDVVGPPSQTELEQAVQPLEGTFRQFLYCLLYTSDAADE